MLRSSSRSPGSHVVTLFFFAFFQYAKAWLFHVFRAVADVFSNTASSLLHGIAGDIGAFRRAGAGSHVSLPVRQRHPVRRPFAHRSQTRLVLQRRSSVGHVDRAVHVGRLHVGRIRQHGRLFAQLDDRRQLLLRLAFVLFSGKRKKYNHGTCCSRFVSLNTI